MTKIKNNPARGKPLSSHPLFPAVVALWFGALFGLGSLAIRPSLIEKLVLKSGLDLMIPAAAPPLGVTARILIALVMAATGATIGAMLAMRINRPQIEQKERRRGASPRQDDGAAGRGSFIDSPVCRPISAHEELGDTLDSQSPLAGRRRSLTVNMEEQPFQPHEVAPLPDGEPPVFDHVAARTSFGEAAPLDLGSFAAPLTVAEIEPCEEPRLESAQASLSEPAPLQPVEASPLSEAPRIFGLSASEGHLPVDFVKSAGFRTSVFETETAQPLFAGRSAAADRGIAEHQDAQPDRTVAEDSEPAAPAVSDLAARLQESMARRRAAKVAQTAAATAPAELEPAAAESEPEPVESDFVPPPPLTLFEDYRDELPDAPALPGIQPAQLPIPAALRPIRLDLDDGEEQADPLDLAPRHLAMPAPDEAESVTPTPEPDGFASLTDLQPRQEFVRIEEPEDTVTAIEPVVIFPGQMASNSVLRPFDAPASASAAAPVAETLAAPTIDPAEAQIALRSALANLQRISGAA